MTDHKTGPGDTAHELKRLHRIARLLDASLGIPFTRIRFGLDSIVGLLPVGGDVAMAAVGLYIVYRGHKLGARPGIVARMLVNLTADTLLGTIPIAGDIADVFFKANLMNVRLLEDELRGQLKTGTVIDV